MAAQRIDHADLERIRQLIDASRAWLPSVLSEGRDAALAAGATIAAGVTGPQLVTVEAFGCECPDDCRVDHEYQ